MHDEIVNNVDSTMHAICTVYNIEYRIQNSEYRIQNAECNEQYTMLNTEWTKHTTQCKIHYYAKTIQMSDA